jgi:Ca-activated chloride channel family protein
MKTNQIFGKSVQMIPGIILFTVFLNSLMIHAAYGQKPEKGDKCASPYFFVKSDDAEHDQLPLRSTETEVNIAGVIANVKIVQQYKNEGKKPIEAIYIFPASTRAAVHTLHMKIGERTIIAVVKERKQARQDYDNALKNGQSATLLEEQRPNVFQMNVGNIMPGDLIEVELQYAELLIPENGIYEFDYPTVVGPRYNSPNNATASTDNNNWVANPYTRQGEKPLSTFNITCSIAAGMPINGIKSTSHEVDIAFSGPNAASIKLKGDNKYQGNKDFILQYQLCGKQVETGVLLYPGKDENFFLAMIQPPATVTKAMIPDREYIFIVDVSGSMSGFPLDISKKLLKDLIGNLRATDKFNVLLFAGGSDLYAQNSVPATAENLNKAVKFIDNQRGGGGTELLPALNRALNLPQDENMSRTFVIATDGYVAVEKEAFNLIRKSLSKANFFAFGIGSSVNRYIIEGMAKAGMGMPFVVTSQQEAEPTANRFREYIQSPVLTNIAVKYNGFQAYDIEPLSLPDVFAQRPVVIFGKYRGTPTGSIEITGQTGECPYKEVIAVRNENCTEKNLALKYLWARERIRNIDDFGSADGSNDEKDGESQVTQLGLKYNLLTRFTSFIAVDSEKRNQTGKTTQVNMPLPLPDGVSDYAVGGTVNTTQNLGYSAPANNQIYGNGYNTRSVKSIEMIPGKYETLEKSKDVSLTVCADSIYTINQPATFPGGETALKAFLTKNLIYPPQAKKNGLTGVVKISFSVNPDGSISDIKIVKSIGGGCDAEAIRLINLMPKWIPARKSGKAIKSQVLLPIKFSI